MQIKTFWTGHQRRCSGFGKRTQPVYRTHDRTITPAISQPRTHGITKKLSPPLSHQTVHTILQIFASQKSYQPQFPHTVSRCSSRHDMSRFPARRCLIDILYTEDNFLKLPPQETTNARPTILNLVSLNQMTAITANGRYLCKRDEL